MSTILAILGVLGTAAVGMAITQLANRISAVQSLHHYAAAPGATTLQTGPWFDIRKFRCFMASYFKMTGTGQVTTFQIVASNKNDGTGTNVVVFSSAFPVLTPATQGNQVFLECTQQQIAQLAADNGIPLIYVAAQWQQATGGDTGVLTYLATEPTVLAATFGLTADAAS